MKRNRSIHKHISVNLFKARSKEKDFKGSQRAEKKDRLPSKDSRPGLDKRQVSSNTKYMGKKVSYVKVTILP